jgi:hypothetical protein
VDGYIWGTLVFKGMENERKQEICNTNKLNKLKVFTRLSRILYGDV